MPPLCGRSTLRQGWATRFLLRVFLRCPLLREAFLKLLPTCVSAPSTRVHAVPSADVLAACDAGEFVVGAILDHRFVGRGRRSQLWFLVRWAGYPESANTWETLRNCLGNTLLAGYAQRKGLRLPAAKEVKPHRSARQLGRR